MAEETMETGSRSDRKLMEDAGFSEELKRQLEERINQTAFNALHQQAVSEAEMPVRMLMVKAWHIIDCSSPTPAKARRRTRLRGHGLDKKY